MYASSQIRVANVTPSWRFLKISPGTAQIPNRLSKFAPKLDYRVAIPIGNSILVSDVARLPAIGTEIRIFFSADPVGELLGNQTSSSSLIPIVKFDRYSKK